MMVAAELVKPQYAMVFSRKLIEGISAFKVYVLQEKHKSAASGEKAWKDDVRRKDDIDDKRE